MGEDDTSSEKVVSLDSFRKRLESSQSVLEVGKIYKNPKGSLLVPNNFGHFLNYFFDRCVVFFADDPNSNHYINSTLEYKVFDDSTKTKGIITRCEETFDRDIDNFESRVWFIYS